MPVTHCHGSIAFFGLSTPDAIKKYLNMAKRPQKANRRIVAQLAAAVARVAPATRHAELLDLVSVR